MITDTRGSRIGSKATKKDKECKSAIIKRERARKFNQDVNDLVKLIGSMCE